MRYIINLIIRIGIIKLFTVFFVLVNIFTFFLYLTDKRRAVRGKRRISENALVLFTVTCGGIGAFLGMRFAKHKTRSRKFAFVSAIGVVIAIIPLIHIAHALTLDSTVRYVEIDFHSGNLPIELNGYRIAFITDTHAISEEDMRAVAAELNKRNLDLLLLGGDFAMGSARYRDTMREVGSMHFLGTLREVANVKTTDGIYGVDGNHDDHILLFSAMEQHGIVPLDNSGVHVREGFYLAGVQDLWLRNPNIKDAVSNANADDFVLLVSHNPDVSMLQSTKGIDLILSGHTHRGQITFFGFPMYLLRGSITRYGTRFAYGFADSADGVPVYTSSGIGEYYAIPRIFARPEVVIFTMYSK